MEAILKRKKLWNIVETKHTISVFPITIDGIIYESEERLNSEKQQSHSSLILSVANSLIGIVVGKKDPANSWDILCKMYDIGDQQILFLTYKLHNISLREGGDVTTYLMEASNLRNHFSALGETISDKQLISIVLNGLPRSYDIVIQGISYMTNPIFEDVMGKILMENQRMAIRDQKMGKMKLWQYSLAPIFSIGEVSLKLLTHVGDKALEDLQIYTTQIHRISFKTLIATPHLRSPTVIFMLQD